MLTAACFPHMYCCGIRPSTCILAKYSACFGHSTACCSQLRCGPDVAQIFLFGFIVSLRGMPNGHNLTHWPSSAPTSSPHRRPQPYTRAMAAATLHSRHVAANEATDPEEPTVLSTEEQQAEIRALAVQAESAYVLHCTSITALCSIYAVVWAVYAVMGVSAADLSAAAAWRPWLQLWASACLACAGWVAFQLRQAGLRNLTRRLRRLQSLMIGGGTASLAFTGAWLLSQGTSAALMGASVPLVAIGGVYMVVQEGTAHNADTAMLASLQYAHKAV